MGAEYHNIRCPHLECGKDMELTLKFEDGRLIGHELTHDGEVIDFTLPKEPETHLDFLLRVEEAWKTAARRKSEEEQEALC